MDWFIILMIINYILFITTILKNPGINPNIYLHYQKIQAFHDTGNKKSKKKEYEELFNKF